MKKVKKIVLGISLAFTMLVALIVGVCINSANSLHHSVLGEYNNLDAKENIVKYTYAPNEIKVQKGGKTLNYEYTPNATSEQSKTIAYEYCFSNPMEQTTAINLKYIDTTGVKVSYLYTNDKINTELSHTTETQFKLQELSPDEKIYIYIIVSPLNEEIPSTLTESVRWYYGIPKKIPVYDGVTGQKVNDQTIITGQPLDNNALIKPAAPTSEVVNNVTIPYYFDGWFKDKDGTIPVGEGESLRTEQMYAKYANLPNDWLTVSGNEAHVKQGTSQLPQNLVIPSTYNGKKVTQIGPAAFENNTTIKTVDLPSTIKDLRPQCFNGCSNLESIDIKDGVQIIYAIAFRDCTSLKEIILPDSVTTLGTNGYQFNGCTSLTKVVLSSKITYISRYMFKSCTNLSEINMPAGITYIGEYAFDGCSKLIDLKGLSNCNKLEIIGYTAFNNCDALVNVDLSGCANLETIDSYAFYSCNKLTNLNLSSGIKTIGNYAFYNCNLLTNVGNSSTCTNLKTIGDYAFSVCNSLVTFDLSNCTKLESIGEGAFIFDVGKSNLKSLGDLSKCTSLTTIGQQAFLNCTELEGDCVIPASVTKIGQRAFRRTGWDSITFANTSGWWVTTNTDYSGGTELTSADLSTNSTTYLKTTYYTYYWRNDT